MKDREQFKALFEEYYNPLCNFVYRYVNDRDVSEDMVQSVFVRLWEKRDSLELTGSLRSYLFTATRNTALDHIRSQKRKDEYI
jgi:RNA polymerase sigma-70 factor (ECF subfamily)